MERCLAQLDIPELLKQAKITLGSDWTGLRFLGEVGLG